jgi:hypothetical protein
VEELFLLSHRSLYGFFNQLTYALNSAKRLEYENKIKVINQSYELLLDVLQGVQINISKYSLLEDTGLVQSLLPKSVKTAPLGKTALELWTENYGDVL